MLRIVSVFPVPAAVDHADPVPEGLGDSVALVLVSVERQNDGLIRILRFPVHPVEIGGEGAVGVDEVQPLVPFLVQFSGPRSLTTSFQ